MIVLALALLIGSAAAFTRSERLKLERSPVAKPKFDRHFSPTCDCARSKATLTLLLRSPERVDVSVVDLDGGHVATLAEARDLEAGRASFEWDGRNDEGQVVPDGRYRLKVRLERDRRTILVPKTIVVDTAPPTVRVVEATQTPDGLLVRYRADEAARASLRRNGKPVARGEAKSSRAGRITWQPAGQAQDAGNLTIVAVDRAGNRSAVMPVIVAP